MDTRAQLHASADHAVSPPRIAVPRSYNAAVDLIERNLVPGKAERVAVVDDTGRYTYRELASRVNRCANALRRLGLRQEDRVALLLLDTIDFPTAFLGAIKAGIVPIPCNTLLTATDYAFLLADSRARAVIVSSALYPLIAPLAGSLPALEHVIVSGDAPESVIRFTQWLAPEATDAVAAPTTSDDVCFWLYSSGSTGTPKGAVHLHSDLIHTAELYARPVLGIAENDVVFSAAKLFFAYGLGNALTFPMAVGATAVLMAERSTPSAVFARLVAHRPDDFLRRADALRRDARRAGFSCARRAVATSLRFRRRGASGRTRQDAGVNAPASIFSTGSVRPKCCTSFCPTVRATCAMARPGDRCRVTKCDWSTTLGNR